MNTFRHPLCQNCDEKDLDWRINGAVYEQRVVCVYDLAPYPNAHECSYFLPKRSAEEEAE